MNYSIKEMSKLTNLPASTLRYYDKEGLLPSLKRNSNNARIFDDDDYVNLKIIECLKKSGLSIKDIKAFIAAAEQGDESLEKRLKIFRKRRKILKQELEELQEVLDVIEYKCWYYETACSAGTEENMKNMKLSDVPEKFRKKKFSLLTFSRVQELQSYPASLITFAQSLSRVLHRICFSCKFRLPCAELKCASLPTQLSKPRELRE